MAACPLCCASTLFCPFCPLPLPLVLAFTQLYLSTVPGSFPLPHRHHCIAASTCPHLGLLPSFSTNDPGCLKIDKINISWATVEDRIHPFFPLAPFFAFALFIFIYGGGGWWDRFQAWVVETSPSHSLSLLPQGWDVSPPTPTTFPRTPHPHFWLPTTPLRWLLFGHGYPSPTCLTHTFTHYILFPFLLLYHTFLGRFWCDAAPCPHIYHTHSHHTSLPRSPPATHLPPTPYPSPFMPCPHPTPPTTSPTHTSTPS